MKSRKAGVIVNAGTLAEPIGEVNAVNSDVENSGDGGTSIKLGGNGLLADGHMAGIEWSVSGSGVIAFDWKVSSEESYDWLRFYEVGGSVTNQVSGTGSDWRRIFITISGTPDAIHTVRWEYAKDPLGDFVGQDCGWVDAMVWAPTYSLTVNGGIGEGAYTNGAAVVIVADTSPVHFELNRWTGDTNTIANILSSTTVVSMPETNVVVTATYTPIQYELTVTNGSGGGLYPYGENVEIGSVMFENKRFFRWVGDIASVADVTSATTSVQIIGQPISIAATYLVPLTVTFGTGGGWHLEGATVVVAANEDPLYKEFVGWTGDGAELLANASARSTTLTMPTRLASLTATYRDSIARVAGRYGHAFTVSGTTNGVSIDLTAGSPSLIAAVKLGGAGVVPDNGFASFETAVSGSGTVTFWWRVSSESNADYLKFLVDGVQMAAISGTKGTWIQLTNRVDGAGVTHTLRWEYVKNGSLASNNDAGWVDDIVWTGDVPVPVITPNVFAFAFLGEHGIPYSIYSNATLKASVWALMETVPQEIGETNGLFRFEATIVPNAGQPSCFYRVLGGN